MAELGAKVACVDINSIDNDTLVKSINSSGYIAHAFECDLTNKNDVIRTTNAIEKRFGYITILFHCCGVPSARSLITEPPPIQTTLNLSVISHFWVIILQSKEFNPLSVIILSILFFSYWKRSFRK